MNLLQYKSGRNFFAFAFYFAEGAPIGFIWWAMPTILRKNGAGTEVIGTITATVLLPWIFKFLWAPLVDIYHAKTFGFKKWIAFSQTGMCITLLPLLFIPLQDNYTTWGLLLLVHAIFAATQDVAVDALMIRMVSSHEKGLLNGYMQAGMLLGRSLFGGGFLILSEFAGLHIAIGIMIFVILSIMLLLFLVEEPPTAAHLKTRATNFWITIKKAFSTRQTWFGIGFALTAAAAFEAAGAFAGPLLTDKNISQQSIGFFFAIPVVIAMLLGGLAGGFISDKIQRNVAITIYLLGFVLMVSLLGIVEINNLVLQPFIWMALYSGMYFFTGMFTAASYALFMDLTNPRLGATQFSTYMAATNGCEAWVAYSAGILVAGSNYGTAFLIMCMVSVASLLLLKKTAD